MRCVCEVVLLSKLAVDPACDNRRGRTLHAACVSAKEDGERDFWMGFVRVSEKPPDFRWRRVIVARAGFADGHFITATVETGLAGAVQNRREQAFANFWKDRSDI